MENQEPIPEIPVCKSAWILGHRLFNRETGQVLELSCKSWRCPVHKKNWLTKWRIVVLRELNINPIDRLVTLTCSSDCTPIELSRARQLLMRDLRANYGDIAYLAVLEFTTLTRLPHLHLLIRGPYIPQSELSLLWKKATTAAGIKPSTIVYIEAPKSQNGSAIYALSYALDSGPKNQDIPDDWHGRKITYSKNFFIASTVKEHWLNWIRETFGEKPGGDDWELISAEFGPVPVPSSDN